jgi:hypothetical protein
MRDFAGARFFQKIPRDPFREIIYAEEPNMAQKGDPIDWWRENEKKFPKLAL